LASLLLGPIQGGGPAAGAETVSEDAEGGSETAPRVTESNRCVGHVEGGAEPPRPSTNRYRAGKPQPFVAERTASWPPSPGPPPARFPVSPPPPTAAERGIRRRPANAWWSASHGGCCGG